MEKIDFKKEKYSVDLITEAFGLERSVKKCEVLDSLINTTGDLDKRIADELERYRIRLEEEVDFWNEEELKMHFLSRIFDLADINEPKKIKLFYERSLKEEIDHQEIAIVCDCMVARPLGVNTPRTPYFFLQEFKKARKPDDPEGQMLLAMIVAQYKNNNGKPIYGCYLIGRYWVFTTLHHKKYCVSHSFDASRREELHQIIFILQNLKQIILREWEE